MVFIALLPKFLEENMTQSVLDIFRADCAEFGFPVSGKNQAGETTMTTGNVVWSWNFETGTICRKAEFNNLYWSYE